MPRCADGEFSKHARYGFSDFAFVEFSEVQLPLYGQPVEKVLVGPVGGPRKPENKAKTPQKQRIQPLNRGQKRARRGF
jgi:hypothetical protein